MVINSKIKKQLKALANTSKHKYQIGKDEIDENVISMLNAALKAHELIKVYFNKPIIGKMEELTKAIVDKTKSILVDSIGHMIILYKENLEKKDRIRF